MTKFLVFCIGMAILLSGCNSKVDSVFHSDTAAATAPLLDEESLNDAIWFDYEILPSIVWVGKKYVRPTTDDELIPTNVLTLPWPPKIRSPYVMQITWRKGQKSFACDFVQVNHFFQVPKPGTYLITFYSGDARTKGQFLGVEIFQVLNSDRKFLGNTIPLENLRD